MTSLPTLPGAPYHVIQGCRRACSVVALGVKARQADGRSHGRSGGAPLAGAGGRHSHRDPTAFTRFSHLIKRTVGASVGRADCPAAQLFSAPLEAVFLGGDFLI